MPVTDPLVAADDQDAVRGARAALRRYRFMAYVVGTGLLILVFVGVPLQYGAGLPQLAQVVGIVHGAMYIVYLMAAVDLSRRGGLNLRQLAMMVLAGFVPFVAFVVERKVTSVIERELAGSGDLGTGIANPSTTSN
jgi:integral membrane protein